MILYPDLYLKKVEDITIEILQKNKLKALILDLDNTLIDYNKNLSDTVVEWAKNLKGQGVKIYILSNSRHKEKVEKVAKKLGVEYSNFAKKPLKTGFLKVQKILNEEPEKVAVVGDQIFTDVIGGNRCKMFTILVEPIDRNTEYWYTSWKRPLEDRIINKYKNEITKEKK